MKALYCHNSRRLPAVLSEKIDVSSSSGISSCVGCVTLVDHTHLLIIVKKIEGRVVMFIRSFAHVTEEMETQQTTLIRLDAATPRQLDDSILVA